MTPARATPPADHPLACLPEGEWRVMVADFCGCYANVLGGDVLGVSMLLAFWHRDGGLTLEEARAVLTGLLKPAAVGRIRHRGELNAELGRAAEEVIKSRRAKEAAARYRPEPFVRQPGEAQLIHEILSRRKPTEEPPA